MKRRHHYETRPAPTEEDEERELPLSYSWWLQNDPKSQFFDGFIGFAKDQNENCCHDCLCNDDCEIIEICRACPSVITPPTIEEYRFQATGCENDQDDPSTPDIDETEHKYGWSIGQFPDGRGEVVPATERWRQTYFNSLGLKQSEPAYYIGYFVDLNKGTSFSQTILDDEGEPIPCGGNSFGGYEGGGSYGTLEALTPWEGFEESSEYEGIYVPTGCNRVGGIWRGSVGTFAWTNYSTSMTGLDNTLLGGGIVKLIKPLFPNEIKWSKCPPRR
jgi:hypothetical protein